MLTYISYTLTITLVLYIFTTKSYFNSVALLICSTLINIPILMFGNSSSAGVFPVDFCIFSILIRYFILGNKSFIPRTGRRLIIIFICLLLYVIFRGLFAIFINDYGYENRFIIYGIFKWLEFYFLLIIFTQKLDENNFNTIIKIVTKIFFIYFIFSILNQHSIIDLSGFVESGHINIYDDEELAAEAFRAFLGNNATNVGFISCLGIFLSIFLRTRSYRAMVFNSLFFLSSISLLGSFSRSDVIAMGGCIIIGISILIKSDILIVFRKISKNLFILIFLFASFLITSSELEISKNATFGRYIGTDYTGELSGRSSGTLGYRVAHWDMAKNYLISNPLYGIFGFGPNGYRILVKNGVGEMNFGHNAYIHTIAELGLVGFILLSFWLIFLLKKIWKFMHYENILIRNFSFIVFLITFHRLITGFSVDTLFATDNAFSMNVLFLSFVGFLFAMQDYLKITPNLNFRCTKIE